jgi:hypothetical protein
LTLLAAAASFAQISELESKYGPEYFFAIQGEVTGQAAPGVQAVFINGRQVAIKKDLTFAARVTLKQGEKYLSIETRYKGLYFTKKYLVIRHPQAPKVFKINVPQTVFKQMVSKKRPAVKKRVRPKKALLRKIVAPPKPKPLVSHGFKNEEFQGRYQGNAASLLQAIKTDDYGIKLSGKGSSLSQLNEVLRQPNLYDKWKKKGNKTALLGPLGAQLIKETGAYRHKPFSQLTKEQQQKIIRLNRIILEATYGDLAPQSQPLTAEELALEKLLGGSSFGYKSTEFKKGFDLGRLSNTILADNYGVSLEAPVGGIKWLNELLRQPDFYDRWKKAQDKAKDQDKGYREVILSPEILRLIKETAGYRSKPFDKLTKEQKLKIIKLNRLLLEATYPLLSPKSRLETEADKWLGFEFVAELEPNRLMIVRRVDGKYFSAIYDVQSRLWVHLDEVNHQELVDLLEEGTIPLFIGPAK